MSGVCQSVPSAPVVPFQAEWPSGTWRKNSREHTTRKENPLISQDYAVGPAKEHTWQAYLHELAQVELWRLEDLDLPDEGVLQGVDARSRLLNLLSDQLRDELLHQLLQVAALRLPGDDLHHLLPDLQRSRKAGNELWHLFYFCFNTKMQRETSWLCISLLPSSLESEDSKFEARIFCRETRQNLPRYGPKISQLSSQFTAEWWLQRKSRAQGLQLGTLGLPRENLLWVFEIADFEKHDSILCEAARVRIQLPTENTGHKKSTRNAS